MSNMSLVSQECKLSIVIPSFNTSKMLKMMVESILVQTYQYWELLIVDDGSKDGTLEMLSHFTDSRIKIINRDRTPKGGQTCRNIGFERSKGEFIVFFDSDDLISRRCLEQRILYLENHPELDFAVFPAITFNDEKKVNTSNPCYGINKNLDTLTAILSSNYQYTVWTNIYRRESLLKAGIKWDEQIKVYQDFDFNLAVALASFKYDYAVDAEVDYLYRIDYSKSSVCSNVLSEEKNVSTCYLFKKTLGLLSNRDDYDTRRIELYQFAHKHIERLVVGGSTHLLEVFFDVLDQYYKERKYQHFHAIIIKTSNDLNIHKRIINYWKHRVFTLGEYKYLRHFVKELISK